MTLTAWVKPLILESLLPILFAYTSWTVQGWHKDKVIADLQRGVAKDSALAAGKLITATNRVRTLEQILQTNITARKDQLNREKEDAKHVRDRLIADIRNGNIRLSIPTTSCTQYPPTKNPPAAVGSGNEARSELDAAAASTLETIAGDGDDGIRQLNACIDNYNEVREKYNVQAR